MTSWLTSDSCRSGRPAPCRRRPSTAGCTPCRGRSCRPGRGSRTATGTARRRRGSWSGAVVARVDRVERLPRDDEHEDDDDRRDDRPHELGDVVAVGLRRQCVVARLAPIADDRPDDQPFDDEEDRDRDEEDDRVEIRGSPRPAS